MAIRHVLIALWGLVGCVVGSFLNVVIDRAPSGGSLLGPPSHCPQCQRRLTAWELIPVVSYVWLRGRCRTCGASIPVRVLAVELVTGLLFALFLWRYGPTARMLLYTVYSAILVVIFFIDLEHQLILNIVSLPATGLALLAIPLQALLMRPPYGSYAFLWLLLGQGAGWSVPLLVALGAFLGGLIAFGVFWLIWRVTPEGMGAGDVKLAAYAGLITGFPGALFAVFGSWILGGVVAVGLLLARRGGLKTAIPFGPFLVMTTLAMLLFGDTVVLWYIAR